jgi:hypothetical protein
MKWRGLKSKFSNRTMGEPDISISHQNDEIRLFQLNLE